MFQTNVSATDVSATNVSATDVSVTNVSATNVSTPMYQRLKRLSDFLSNFAWDFFFNIFVEWTRFSWKVTQ